MDGNSTNIVVSDDNNFESEEEILEPVENSVTNVDNTEINKLTDLINQQTEEIKMLKEQLNKQFQQSAKVEPESDVEQFLNSAGSLTHKLLVKYGIVKE